MTRIFANAALVTIYYLVKVLVSSLCQAKKHTILQYLKPMGARDMHGTTTASEANYTWLFHELCSS